MHGDVTAGPGDETVTDALLGGLDGVGYVLDTDGNLVDWNDRLPAVTGYDDAAVAGMHATDLVAPDDRERVEAAIDAVLATGRTTVDAALYTEAGTTLPYEFSARRIDDDGAVAGIVGVGRPADERAQLRERLVDDPGVVKLFDHCEGVDATFPEVMDAVIAYGRERLGLDYGFLTRIEGDVQEVLIAQGTHDLLQPGETCPLSEAYCRRTIREETLLGVNDAVAEGWEDDRAYETFELGAYIGAKVVVDGSLFGTLCYADSEPRVDFSAADRRLVELLAAWTSRELTAQSEEGVFAHRQARIEEFASMVSHDLRNPLTVAMGRVEVADGHLAGDDLDAVADALGRMDELIDDVLALVKGGETVEETRQLDGEAVAREAWSNVDTGDAELEVEPFTVAADDSRLLQLFENLYRNAVEHGGTGVTVRVGPTDEGFYVADDGPGIDEGVRERVFERGFSSTSSGTGLGLNIVRSIAGAHGWRVHVEESADGGARFVVADAEVAMPAE